jgi:integrase
MVAHSLSLFATTSADQLATDLAALFDAWLASAPGRGAGRQGRLREESADIYGDMWGAFVSFCVPLDPLAEIRQIRFDPQQVLERDQLLLFLQSAGTGSGRKPAPRSDGETLSLRYAWRMLHLIDRVLNFGREQAGLPRLSAARDLLQEAPYCYANASSQTPVAETLTDAETHRLMAYLTQIQHIDAQQDVSWKELRDRTAAALMLGAGLAPGQVRALRLDDVTIAGGRHADVPWRLTVLADGSCAEHHAPIADWAGRQLAFWLQVRQSQGMAPPFVFPSTASGKAWSHPACHRAVVTVMNAAGVDGGSPFRLRHSFAVRQLGKGHSEDEVARWMGYADTTPLKRYRHLVTRPPVGMA